MFCCCKLKTAYEMRSSDWSSDVCSSYLVTARIQNENRRAFMEIRDWLLLPFADPACGNKFSSCGEIAGDAKGSILMARCQQVFKQLVVPERCFAKKL